MSKPDPPKLQKTVLFRIVSFFTHLRVGYIVRFVKNARLFVVLFAVFAGVVALGIITAVAYVTNLPLLFPPLAATTFILFNAPLAERASPRSVVGSHTLALLSGLGSLLLLAALFPGANLPDPSSTNWARVAAISLAMGVISLLMTSFRCVHPPAAATAMIASMGYVGNPMQMLGLIAAVILLVVEAYLLNNVIGGIPYPKWSYNPEAANNYRELAGVAGSSTNFWEQMSTRIARRR